MLINGGIAVDDRGSVTFINDFDFKDVKRFYMVSNHSKGFIRAWHGHKKEAKYVLVTRGAALVCTTPLDEYDLEKVVLSATKPQILHIPAGYYNGFKTLTDDAQLMFFSTSTLEESAGDDIRLPADQWSNVWEIEQR